jgi:hypothetical protein
MTVVRLVRGQPALPGSWWLLGLAWLAGLTVAALLVARRPGDGGLEDLLKNSTALVLVVFLTRTWTAEANVLLVLPMALMLSHTGALDRRLLTALWLLPLVFTAGSMSELHLLWVVFPHAMQRALADAVPYEYAGLVVKAAVVVLWQAVGWWIVVTCLRGGVAVRARLVPAGREG